MTDAAVPRFRAEARRPWLLLAPALIILIVLLVLPILVMLRFTFYEFVTAGVERDIFTAANWREFFSDPYYHGFLWKTARVSARAVIGSSL